MYLNEKLCQIYYCTQARGGGDGAAYFQGARYQRGGGFFQNIFRTITPLIKSAGKYFGKKLLKTGGNVLSDIASGSLLKDSARARLREETKNIKDDLFEKLRQQRGEGIKKNVGKDPRSQRSIEDGLAVRGKDVRRKALLLDLHLNVVKHLTTSIETYFLKKI